MRAARPRVLAALLLLAPVAAGCIDAPASPAADGRLVAFVDAPEEHGPNRTLLALREGGAADRLTYLADGSWVPRLAPGLDYSEADLARLFADAPASGGERGGLVLRVERGRVPQDALDGLAPFLQGEWPRPFLPPDVPHPWYRPVVLARLQPHALTEAPPDADQHAGAEHARLVDLSAAFGRARDAFAADRVEDATLPMDAAWDGCLRAATSTSPEAARVGDVIEVRVEVENCGRGEVVLDPAACAGPPAAHVQVGGIGGLMSATLPGSEAPHAAHALDLQCRGDAAPVRLAPGERATLRRQWNGSFAACGAGGCAYRAAGPGQYHVSTFVSGHHEASPAGVTLVARDAATTRLLVVREHDWVNGTAEEPLHASFGPHCAPVRYTLDPPTATIWYDEHAPEVGPGLVVRDWREGERPERVVTMSADRLDLVLLGPDGAALASPFDPALPLANVTLDGEDFVVDGTRVPPGGQHVARVEHVLERDGGAYRVASVLAFENHGEAALVWARALGCA